MVFESPYHLHTNQVTHLLSEFRERNVLGFKQVQLLVVVDGAPFIRVVEARPKRHPILGRHAHGRQGHQPRPQHLRYETVRKSSGPDCVFTVCVWQLVNCGVVFHFVFGYVFMH